MMSLIYVSRCLIDPADRTPVLEDILVVSLARNTTLGITGLLIVAPGHFAQLIEGPEPAIAAVMSSITVDPRHAGCRVVCQTTISQASRPHWRIVRYDSAGFGTAAIDPLLMAAHAGTDVNAVTSLEWLIGAVADDPIMTRTLVRP